MIAWQKGGLDRWQACNLPHFGESITPFQDRHQHDLFRIFLAFDDIFFGSALAAVVDIQWSEHSEIELGRTLCLLPNSAKQSPAPKKNAHHFSAIEISLPKPEGPLNKKRILWSQDRVTKVLGTILHEMTHAYFFVYGSDCCTLAYDPKAKDTCTLQRRSEVGFGHGDLWVETIEAIATVASKILSTDQLKLTPDRFRIMEGRLCDVRSMIRADYNEIRLRNETGVQQIFDMVLEALLPSARIDRLLAWNRIEDLSRVQAKHLHNKGDHMLEGTMLKIHSLSKTFIETKNPISLKDSEHTVAKNKDTKGPKEEGAKGPKEIVTKWLKENEGMLRVTGSVLLVLVVLFMLRWFCVYAIQQKRFTDKEKPF